LPSNTSAKASIRRAASASFVRPAARRSSADVHSRQVIKTAVGMPASFANQEAQGIMPKSLTESP
jgi:hypothetical protein